MVDSLKKLVYNLRQKSREYNCGKKTSGNDAKMGQQPAGHSVDSKRPQEPLDAQLELATNTACSI
jgi:hypothetical protein